MPSFEDKTASFIQRHDLFAGAESIVLAISGGADSIALLYVMHALVSSHVVKANLVCVHVNHHLRGAQSDGDQAFVVEQATGLGIPVLVKTADVKAHAKTHRLSVETAARELRLACLAEVARSCGCPWIVTGHQKNDNAETVTQRLARGTGFRGLAGIRPWREWVDGLKLASPLLDCTREEVATYLQSRDIPWREDRTNTDCAYRRNFIRHQLLPALQSRTNDSLVEVLGSLATSAERLYRQIVIHAQQATIGSVVHTERQAAIEVAAVASLPPLVGVELIRQQLVGLGCGERDLTQRHYRDILRLAQPGAHGRQLTIPNGFLARRDERRIILGRPAKPSEDGNSPQAIELEIPGMSYFDRYRINARIIEAPEFGGVKINRDKSRFLEYLDLDRIAWPLSVRYRRRGDRFQALGMPTETKVGKFLTAAKVPELRRRHVLVFCDRQGILWLCPVRLGQQARVTQNTRRLLELTVTEEKEPGNR